MNPAAPLSILLYLTATASAFGADEVLSPHRDDSVEISTDIVALSERERRCEALTVLDAASEATDTAIERAFVALGCATLVEDAETLRQVH